MSVETSQSRLSVVGLEYRYAADGPALRVARLTAEGGQLIGVCAINGGYKTTLLELLGQLRQPQTGRIVYEYSRGGERRVAVFPGDCPPERLRHDAVGFLFPRHALLPGLRAVDNVALPLRLASLPADVARQRLRQAELPEPLWHRLPAALSVGEGQRAAVARALAPDPPFLLADEGTNGIDAQSCGGILRLLHDHARHGNVVLFVSHQLDLLARWCDRVLVIHDGGFVYPFAGDPDDPAPAGPGLFGEARPVADPVGEEGRPLEQTRRLRDALQGYLWPLEPPRPAAAAPPPPAAVPPPAAPPRRGARLGIAAVGVALKEVFTRRHLGRRLMLGAILAGVVASAVLVPDFLRGGLRRARQRVLRDTPPGAIAARPAGERTRLSRADLDYLASLPGIVGVSRRQVLRNFRAFRADGDVAFAVAESVAPGDPLLEPIAADALETAESGVHYLAGGPITAGQHDRAGVLLSEDFVLELGHSGKPPATIDLYMHREGAAGRELPGFDGRLPVPVLGVFRYPQPLLRQTNGGRGLARVYLPEGFLARLARPESWQAGFAYRYLSARTGRPLLADVRVVSGVRVRLAARADAAAVARWLQEPFGAAEPPVDTAGGLMTMRLDFPRRPLERIGAREYRKLTENPPAGVASLDVDEEPITRFIDPLPPLEEEHLVFNRAVLTVADIDRVLPLQARVAAERPTVDVFVRNHEAIARLGSLRALADSAAGVLGVVLLAGLAFFVVSAAFQHVAAKAPEAAILRAHGLGAWQVGWLHGLGLALHLLPACLLGVAIALGLAWAGDGWVAARLDEIEAAGRGDGAALAGRPAAFLSRQTGPLETARELSGTLLAILACLAGGTGLAVLSIAGRDVAAGLRGDPT